MNCLFFVSVSELNSYLVWTGSWPRHRSESSLSSLRSCQWWCQQQIWAQPPGRRRQSQWKCCADYINTISTNLVANQNLGHALTSRLFPPILDPKSALPTLKSPWSLSRMSFTTSSRACCRKYWRTPESDVLPHTVRGSGCKAKQQPSRMSLNKNKEVFQCLGRKPEG